MTPYLLALPSHSPFPVLRFMFSPTGIWTTRHVTWPMNAVRVLAATGTQNRDRWSGLRTGSNTSDDIVASVFDVGNIARAVLQGGE